MAWAKLDDKFHSHPTTWIVGLEANGLFCRAISYCADQLTDGFVPEEWAYAQVPAIRGNRDSHGLIGKLVNAGLWDRIEDGWHIPGYLDFNPSRDEEMARRKEISAQRSEAGKRGAAATWGGKRNGKGNGKPMANGGANE